jgi:hypothetical protein
LKKSFIRIAFLFLTLASLAFTSACTLASPFDKLLAYLDQPPTQVVMTLQPTFTATLPATPTPTQTSTPTVTPIPSDTPTPTVTNTPRPSATPTPTITNTPAPPPPPTHTPPPTDTPTPSWEYQLVELYSYHTDATILSIIVAVQTANGDWIPGLRVVGIDPNGLVTQSEVSADQMTGHSPAGAQVIKAGNTKFEPQPVAIYITGTWTFFLETADGRQVSPSFTVNMDAENREWYFFRFQPGG